MISSTTQQKKIGVRPILDSYEFLACTMRIFCIISFMVQWNMALSFKLLDEIQIIIGY